MRLRKNYTCVLFQSSLNTSELACFQLILFQFNKIILLALLSSLLDSYFSQLGKILGEFTVNVVLDLYGIVTGLLESVVFLQIVCG